MDPMPQVRRRRRRGGDRLGLEIVLGVSAVLISVISLFVAIHQSQIADKMVQAKPGPISTSRRATSMIRAATRSP